MVLLTASDEPRHPDAALLLANTNADISLPCLPVSRKHSHTFSPPTFLGMYPALGGRISFWGWRQWPHSPPSLPCTVRTRFCLTLLLVGGGWRYRLPGNAHIRAHSLGSETKRLCRQEELQVSYLRRMQCGASGQVSKRHSLLTLGHTLQYSGQPDALATLQTNMQLSISLGDTLRYVQKTEPDGHSCGQFSASIFLDSSHSVTS